MAEHSVVFPVSHWEAKYGVIEVEDAYFPVGVLAFADDGCAFVAVLTGIEQRESMQRPLWVNGSALVSLFANRSDAVADAKAERARHEEERDGQALPA